MAYESLILSACNSKLQEILETENEIYKKNPLTRLVSHLLNKQNENNTETLQFMLDPRRCEKG